MTAGQEFCGEDWLRLKKKYVSHDEEDLRRYCFSSAYIVAMLHDSLGIALDDERYPPNIIFMIFEHSVPFVNKTILAQITVLVPFRL